MRGHQWFYSNWAGTNPTELVAPKYICTPDEIMSSSLNELAKHDEAALGSLTTTQIVRTWLCSRTRDVQQVLSTLLGHRRLPLVQVEVAFRYRQSSPRSIPSRPGIGYINRDHIFRGPTRNRTTRNHRAHPKFLLAKHAKGSRSQMQER